MEIRQHKNSANHLIISEPTAEALKVARRLEPNNWAKVQPSGNIVAHIKVLNQFESLLPKKPDIEEPVIEPLVPEFASRDEMDTWLYDNLNDPKVARYITRGLSYKRWNELYASKMTAAQVEEKYSENANS